MPDPRDSAPATTPQGGYFFGPLPGAYGGHFGPLPKSDFNGDKLKQWLSLQTISFQKVITGSLQAGNEIGSANFVTGVSGWQVDGDGNAEFNDILIRGDLVSSNWDGADPPNLSTPDTAANAGFALDASAGAAQFQGNLYIGGTISLLDSNGVAQTTLNASLSEWTGNLSFDGNITIEKEHRARITGFSEEESVTGDWITSYVQLEGPVTAEETGGLSFFCTIFTDPQSVDTSFQVVRIKDDSADPPLTIEHTDGVGTTTSIVEVTGSQFTVLDGSASTPAISFINDLNTGLYRISENNLGLASAGTLAARVSSTAIRAGMTGTVSVPAWSFESDTDAGLYHAGGTGGNASIGIASGGNVALLVSNTRVQFNDGTAPAPHITFQNDNDTGIYRITTNALGITVGGTDAVHVGSGGSSSWVAMRDGLTDVGNHETLRLNRGTGSTVQDIGYFSSWEFDPLTGERRKQDFEPLASNPRWHREWFKRLRPLSFTRISTDQTEFGFRIEDFQEVDDNLKYLTTKGDSWGHSLDEFGLVAVTVDYVQHLEERVAALEGRPNA